MRLLLGIGDSAVCRLKQGCEGEKAQRTANAVTAVNGQMRLIVTIGFGQCLGLEGETVDGEGVCLSYLSPFFFSSEKHNQLVMQSTCYFSIVTKRKMFPFFDVPDQENL